MAIALFITRSINTHCCSLTTIQFIVCIPCFLCVVVHGLFYAGTVSKSEVHSSDITAQSKVSTKDDDVSEQEEEEEEDDDDEDEDEDEDEGSSSEEDSEENEDSDLTPAEIARQKVIKRITVIVSMCVCVYLSVCVCVCICVCVRVCDSCVHV